MGNITIATLEASTEQLLEDLLDFVRSQKELWQQVPWFALEADGRSYEEYPKGISLAYQDGYWKVDIPHCHTFVDLSTGELVSFGGRAVRYTPSRESLFMILTNLEKVNAAKIIETLESATKPRNPAHAYYVPMRNDWRERTRLELDIQRVYVRKTKEKKQP